MQRLRQAELSWLRSGQTTTLFSSETEKEPVSEARGGMASIYPPCLCVCGSGPRVKTSAQVGFWVSMAPAEVCNAGGAAVFELDKVSQTASSWGLFGTPSSGSKRWSRVKEEWRGRVLPDPGL